MGYISREGALEGGRAPIHDREGNIIHKAEFKELRQEIKDSQRKFRHNSLILLVFIGGTNGIRTRVLALRASSRHFL